MKYEFKITKGGFFNTLKLINKDKKSLFYVVLMDVIFLIALFILAQIFNIISQGALARQQIYQLLFLAVFYYLAALFIYSLFKYIILNFVKSVFENNKITFNRLGKFYLLNIIVFLILFLIFFILSLLAASVVEGIAPFVSIIILLLYTVIAYAFVNISHVLFIEGKNLIQSLQMAAKSLIKFNKYYGVYLVILASFVIVFLVFTLFGNALRGTFFQDYNSILQYGDIYTIVFIHTIGIIFYIAILFNRFYFYNIVREKLMK